VPSAVLSIHPGLADNSRLPVLSRPGEGFQVRELLLLLFAGMTAAVASVFLDFGLRIPGHAIIRAVFPMALGLAAVPRQMAGSIMGVGALATAATIGAGTQAGLGAGALTSLTLTGPLLDLALWRARKGWRLYLGFALAGLGANLAALAVRAGPKILGFDAARGRSLAEWWPRAVPSYLVCGLLAGLLSAAVWFQLAARRRRAADGETPS
jgi:hypothetical protein